MIRIHAGIHRMELLTKGKNGKLFIRVLPCTQLSQSIKIRKDLKMVYVQCLQDFAPNLYQTKREPRYWNFQTDGVFLNVSQEEVYKTIMDGVLDRIFKGVDAVVLAYGQTGAGKSFTMTDLQNDYNSRGIIPRVIGELFEERVLMKKSYSVNYSMSFIEIINDRVIDLLSSHKAAATRHPATYRFKKISIIPLKNEDEALKLVFEGERKRSVIKTAPYGDSHKGHSILTIYVESQSLITSDPFTSKAKLHLVDMAGLDSHGNHTSSWKTTKDVAAANRDKTLLEQFLIQLYYRENKKCKERLNHRICLLVHFLGKSLSTTSLLRFVGHIQGNQKDLASTLSVLRFGQRVCKLPSNYQNLKKRPDEDLLIGKLQEQIEALVEQMEAQYMMQDYPSQLNMSQDRIMQVERLANLYIRGGVDDITLFASCNPYITARVLKKMYTSLEAEWDEVKREFENFKSKEEATPLQKGKVSGTLSRVRSKRGKRFSEETLTTPSIASDESPVSQRVGERNRYDYLQNLRYNSKMPLGVATPSVIDNYQPWKRRDNGGEVPSTSRSGRSWTRGHENDDYGGIGINFGGPTTKETLVGPVKAIPMSPRTKKTAKKKKPEISSLPSKQQSKDIQTLSPLQEAIMNVKAAKAKISELFHERYIYDQEQAEDTSLVEEDEMKTESSIRLQMASEFKKLSEAEQKLDEAIEIFMNTKLQEVTTEKLKTLSQQIQVAMSEFSIERKMRKYQELQKHDFSQVLQEHIKRWVI